MATDGPITTETTGVTISVLFRIDDHTVPRQVLAYNGHDVNSTGYGITVNTEFDDPPEGAMRALYGGVSWWESSTTVHDDELHITPRFSG